MEQTRTHLKFSSVIILVFAGLSLLNIVTELALGSLNSAVLPNGAPDNVLAIAKVFLLAVSVICLLPNVYVGIKGLRVAKTPDSSKAHIVWATILFVISLISIISPVLGIVKQGSVTENVESLLSVLIDLVIYFEYIKYAKIVAKGDHTA